MHRHTRRIAAVATITALALTGCSAADSGKKSDNNSAASKKAEQALKDIQGKVLSKGPHGEDPSEASAADLSDADIADIKSKKATAAIVMHYGGNDWAAAQIDGLKSQFAKMGIKLVATTDANFKPDKQVSDLETVMSKKPDIIVSIPTDPVATASAYKKAADAGIKLVFMDNVPNGLKAGTDYVSVVSADNYGNGVTSAHMMAKALGGKGQIGLIHHEADFFVTKQRYDGFKKTIAADYPDIKVVDDKGIAGPDFAGDGQAAASAMLSKNPNLDGIWGVWDVPAEGIMAAARSAGRQDLVITTEDLGTNVAIALAKDKLVAGLGAQRPFDQGVTEAKLAGKALLGQKTPAYVALSALPVDHDNVLEAWKQVYHADPPKDLRDAYSK
ncbi:MAG: monosaccharide transporter substrate-binding protein family [Aeromicrobium sp.]|jgi:ribose transport system substrate-binding protein|nr:monosaccharide transporter substrate-binding protein family [Aeromicrobium sp.]